MDIFQMLVDQQKEERKVAKMLHHLETINKYADDPDTVEGEVDSIERLIKERS